jgi:hypothetical protein
MSPVVQTSVRMPNIEMSDAATPRTSVRPNPNRVEFRSTHLQTPRSNFLCRGLVHLSAFEAPERLREILAQDSRSHIAMSYETSIAWKASLRAHRRRSARPLKVLKPRWSGKPLSAARRFNNYTMVPI